MIAMKEKNKTPKDSMTLLPCFYFVEVSGGQAERASWRGASETIPSALRGPEPAPRNQGTWSWDGDKAGSKDRGSAGRVGVPETQKGSLDCGNRPGEC